MAGHGGVSDQCLIKNTLITIKMYGFKFRVQALTLVAMDLLK
jgi:hypothetical protein